MSSLNKVMLIGNLGKDPETRYTPNGTAVTNVSVATSEKWKDKSSGEMQERTEWWTVVFWDKLAEIAGEYLTKGSKVFVEGTGYTEKWKDKEGNDRYTFKVRGMKLVMLGDPKGGGEQREARDTARPQREQAPASGGQKETARKPGKFDDLEDDIPF